MLALGLGVLVMTTSTTGYGVIGAMAGLLTVKVGWGIVRRRRLHRRWALVGGFALLAVCLGAIFLGQIFEVLDKVILEKAASISAVHRLAVTLHGLHVFVRTFGLGAGLGSDRPDSFAVYLLSNLGALGALLFVSAIWMSYREFRRASRLAQVKTDRARILAVGCGFAANLLAMTAAVPDPAWPVLWVLWGLLLAVCEASAMPTRARFALRNRERGIVGAVPD